MKRVDVMFETGRNGIGSWAFDERNDGYGFSIAIPISIAVTEMLTQDPRGQTTEPNI